MEWALLLWLVFCATWVYIDAKRRRRKHPFSWALGTFLLWIVFFPLYFCTRPNQPDAAESLPNLSDFLKIPEFKREISRLQEEVQKQKMLWDQSQKSLSEASEENAELQKIKFTAEQLSYLNLQEEIALLSQKKQVCANEINAAQRERESVKTAADAMIQELNTKKQEVLASCAAAQESLDKTNNSIDNAKNKLAKLRKLHKGVQYVLDTYFKHFAANSFVQLSPTDLSLFDETAPAVTLKLHSMDVRDLRKAYNENAKIISATLERYHERYATKANRSIYCLMVLALQAELQNILHEMKYGKLEDAVSSVKHLTAKYMQIASDGNQNIAGTLLKFIGEIEYLFLQAVTIEYEYYAKKEQIKQEQAALREQMRQEAEERRALEEQRQQVEKEESKYVSEIENVRAQLLASGDTEKVIQLNERILELEKMLKQVEHKKEEIVSLQNGKAGNVYVISNLGSFGDNVFKIGMTRRLNPQDRVNELGDASVPFKFDVHSFIFSDDAVSLEQKLHTALNDKRVNKVNPRKEFFNASIEELENLVLDIEPTAEFNTTMLAEEYNQSLSQEAYAIDDLESAALSESPQAH